MCVILAHMKKVTTAIIAVAILIILIITARIMFSRQAHIMTADTPDQAVKNYLDMMIPHHMEAVQTSKVIMMDSEITNPEVRLLAARIADAQEFEITQMEGWYQEWTKTPYQFNPAMYKSMMSNPGDATGDLRAKIYLKDMIKHHEHAVEMSKEAREQIAELVEQSGTTDGTLTVANSHVGVDMTLLFAQHVEDTQKKEIEEMKELLNVL